MRYFFLLWVLVQSAFATDPLLRRTPGSWLYGPTPVWTDGNAGTPYMFHPMSETIAQGTTHLVRVSYQVSENTGNCQIRPAIRFSDDGVNWETPKELYTAWQSGNNVTYTQDFVDINSLTSTSPRAWMQFGVQTDNTSGASVNFCKATLRIEHVD